jgi:F-type H+-transporting ATPase subunit b
MNLMLPDSGLLFWMTIIFAIVFFILAKFGFPIITGMVEKRNKRISDSLEAARIAEEALANLQKEQERLISETRTEQARLMQEASAERDRMIAAAQEQARVEAQKIMDDARERIAEEKESAMKEIRNEVAKVSLAIAEKVIRKELSSDAAQKQLIDDLIKDQTSQGEES